MSDDATNLKAAVARNLPPARARARLPSIDSGAPASVEPRSEALAEDYQIGYRKPPKVHQFQPGQSGNPRGRPKGSRSFSSILSDELDKPITAQIRGRTVTMSRREALAQRVIEQALKGDLRAVAVLMKTEGAVLPADSSVPAESPALSAEEEILLQAQLAKLGLGNAQ